MVKNTHGGSGHKKFARKHTTNKGGSKLRVAEEEGEVYAIVTALNGNNMFTCYCIDGYNRLGRIRGKFSGGRGKRDNRLVIGTWVLVGLREWDIDSLPVKTETSLKKQKMQECDLLEVYSDSDKCQLMDTEDENWSALITNDRSRLAVEGTATADCDIIFASEKDIERAELLEKMNSDAEKKISMNKSSIEEEDVEVDFNDI